MEGSLGFEGEMKIQCDVCERAEAAVLCCADEAALCWSCDDAVHAANKLAGKHQRVPLLPRPPPNSSSSSSSNPICDICQEKPGYFFCLEDRALLCRHCDVSVHTASPYASAHRRFLITGVQVMLQHRLNNNSSSNGNTSSSNGNGNGNGNSSSSSSNPLDSLETSNLLARKKLRENLTTNLAADEVEGFYMSSMYRPLSS